MKLHQLHALIALADGGGIRAAARLLHLSQAAVSKALRELEAEQGLALLQRHSGGARLTAAGQALLEHARQIATQVERAGEEMDTLRGRPPARLSIGITPWMVHTLLPEIVTRFRQRMPGVELELYEGLQAVSLPRLRNGQMDLAVAPIHGFVSLHEFHCTPLFRHGCRVFARSGHPALQARSLAELLEQDWAINYSPANQPTAMDLLFSRHGLRVPPERVVCAQSLALLSSLVQSGMLSYGPEPFLSCAEFTGKVQALSLQERLDDVTMGIVRLPGQGHNAAANGFIDCLQQTLRQRMRSSRPDDRALASMLTLLF